MTCATTAVTSACALPGSDTPSDCRCVDGFHNNTNHTECLECKRDHFCVNGSQFVCNADRWTQGLTRQDVCTFRPGLQAGASACVVCGADSCCVGDDHAQTCRARSETVDATAPTPAECLCSAGFAEVVDWAGAPPVCESCERVNVHTSCLVRPCVHTVLGCGWHLDQCVV